MASFWETIDVDGDEMQMYASVPSSSAGFTAPYPAVLVAQHATGVDEFIQDICDRLAAAGYAAVAPNLYHRVTDPELLNEKPRPRPPALLSDPDIVSDINATVNWLRNHDAVQGDRIGVTGFCMGGRVAWLAAASNPALCRRRTLLRRQPNGYLGRRQNAALRPGASNQLPHVVPLRGGRREPLSRRHG